MSVAKRQEACQKFKYCKVCTSSKESKSHQSSQTCPRAQTFQCKNCKEPASLTHNTLLCNKAPYSTRSSKFENTPGRGGGRGGRGGGRGGRGGANGGPYCGRGYNFISVYKTMILQVKIPSKWYLLDNLEISHQNHGILSNHGKDLFLNTFTSQWFPPFYINVTLCQMLVLVNFFKFFTHSNLLWNAIFIHPKNQSWYYLTMVLQGPLSILI